MNFNPVQGISGSAAVAVTTIKKHKAFLLSNTAASAATVILKFMKPDGTATDNFKFVIQQNTGALYFPLRLHSVESTTQIINIMLLM